MFEVPETRYASEGDVRIAYQVFGEGPLDLGIAFSDRGEHELKGVPGRWRLLSVDQS